MKLRQTRFIPHFLAILVLTFAASARATYVSPADFDFKTLLAPPPALDSDQEKQDIDTLLKLQAQRTEADVKRIKAESKMTPFIFSSELGSWFNPDDLPVTADFLGKVFADAHDVCSVAKDVFGRKRPFLTDDRIKPCSEKEKTFSYPSSHSTRAMVTALTLAEILPDDKDAVMAEGKQIGDDRAIAGQHFPTDVAAGRVLAKAIFDKMMQNPDFQAELQKAKAECAAKEPVKSAGK